MAVDEGRPRAAGIPRGTEKSHNGKVGAGPPDREAETETPEKGATEGSGGWYVPSYHSSLLIV